MLVTIDSEEVDEEDYDLLIEDATLHVRLHKPTWGTVQVSWNKVGFFFFLDSSRYIINTQAKYSFTWNIWRSKSHSQPTETSNVSLTGSMHIQYTEVNRPVSNQPTPVTADHAGDLAFQYIEFNRPQHQQADTFNTPLEGTAVFTLVLVGNQPI
jgi:hypothetical protein